MSYTLKQKIGVILFDLPRFLWSVRPSWLFSFGSMPWISMRNRNECLIVNKDKEGVQCDWQWTSDLHIAKVFPSLGKLFMQRALGDYPIVFKDRPERSSGDIDISFIIGHRGIERLPNLLLVLQSIAAQINVSLECIVVEQSLNEEIKASLPNWVRYIHTPLPRPDLPYCRSWALNVGARQAKGKLLVLHDNDFLVPQVYASELMKEFSKGSEVIQLKRFMFYFSQKYTERILRENKLSVDEPPDRIVQNLEAGGSVAVSREAYFAIGGFDESFIGWGGEDNEFWDRAKTRKVCPYGYLPFIHLWHAAQPDKQYSSGRGRYTGDIFKERMSVPREKRIENLKNQPEGHRQRQRVDVVNNLVSTIIPIYNRAELLIEAVNSVLAQTYRPIEIIIIDDGSTDDTAQAADNLAKEHAQEIRVVHQRNSGVGLAREAGRLLARGEFIQYLDSDDILMPKKFELQVTGLRAHPDCAVAYGKTRYYEAGEIPKDVPWKRTGEKIETMFPVFLQSRWWGTSTPLYRREIVDRAGAWTSLCREEDWEYDSRIAALGVKLYYCDEFVSEQRGISSDRLCRRFDTLTWRDRAKAHALIFEHARRAGIDESAPEMRHFARELFLLSRQCGAVGLAKESKELFQLAKAASGSIRGKGLDFKLYQVLTSILGWVLVGKLACFSHRFRKNG